MMLRLSSYYPLASPNLPSLSLELANDLLKRGARLRILRPAGLHQANVGVQTSKGGGVGPWQLLAGRNVGPAGGQRGEAHLARWVGG